MKEQIIAFSLWKSGRSRGPILGRDPLFADPCFTPLSSTSPFKKCNYQVSTANGIRIWDAL